MIRSYITIAFRNILRFKGYTAINLTGLSIGLTIGILVLLFVNDELGYDQFHQKNDRIYKVITKAVDGGANETNAWPVGFKLKNDYPEVEHVLYTRKTPSSMTVFSEGKRYEHEIFYAGESFFDIFSFLLIEGNPKTALVKPYTIVITEEMKERYFGKNDALGKFLTLQDSLEFEITGVIEKIPSQSHIQFEMLISFSTFEEFGFSYNDGWGNFNVRNYILLKENAHINDLKTKAENMYMDPNNEGEIFKQLGKDFLIGFIPLKDIYLKSDVTNGFGPKGSIDKVYLVGTIALFVILLACINFVNLTTARSVYRAKEVGIRKIVGSSRISLIGQFMSEAFLMVFMATAIVALLLDFSLPFFNQVMDKTYTIENLLTASILLYSGGLFLSITILSGYYPAWVLSSYKPVEVLKGSMKNSSRGIKLRRALVVFQFFISGSLVLGTIVVIEQLNFMRNQDLGFDKEQILVVNALRVPKTNALYTFNNRLKSLSAVENVTFTNALPGKPGWLGQWAYPEVKDPNNQVDTEYMVIDENYINTLGLELIAGQNFDTNSPALLNDGLIINETTVKAMGWQTAENAIGRKIVSPSHHPEGTVIGVVKDYHDLGLQSNIWPQAMDYNTENYGRYFAIKIKTGHTSEVIQSIKSNWKEIIGDYNFEYSFLDQDFDKQYKSEDRLMSVFIVFAAITVFIAIVGLLGLVSFMVLSRVKEIGIRKVLGANSWNITGLISKEFLILVFAANIFSIPLIWFYGNQWLESFAYRTALNPIIFIITMVVTLSIALLTVSFQTIKAAMTNPVDILKGE